MDWSICTPYDDVPPLPPDPPTPPSPKGGTARAFHKGRGGVHGGFTALPDPPPSPPTMKRPERQRTRARRAPYVDRLHGRGARHLLVWMPTTNSAKIGFQSEFQLQFESFGPIDLHHSCALHRSICRAGLPLCTAGPDLTWRSRTRFTQRSCGSVLLPPPKEMPCDSARFNWKFINGGPGIAKLALNRPDKQ
eukprot:gene23258-biopygen22300